MKQTCHLCCDLHDCQTVGALGHSVTAFRRIITVTLFLTAINFISFHLLHSSVHVGCLQEMDHSYSRLSHHHDLQLRIGHLQNPRLQRYCHRPKFCPLNLTKPPVTLQFLLHPEAFLPFCWRFFKTIRNFREY